MMMKLTFAGLALALVFFTGAPMAHAQDAAPGTQLQFAGTLGAGSLCGSYPMSCTGATNIGGTFWIDIQPTVGSTGALFLNGVADFGTAIATVTGVGSPYITTNAGTYSSVTISFKGTTTDGDDTYTGTATFHFTWYLYKVWRAKLTSVTFAVTYN
jgi:hypothetical protein